MKKLLHLVAIASQTSLVIALVTIFPTRLVAEELSEIKKRGELKVAVKDNLRPLGFTDKNGNLAGLEIDIARKLAEEILGDEEAVEFTAVNNQERLQVILDHEVDIAIAKVSVTTSRRRIVNFSRHYYLDGTGIITKNPKITKLANLTNARIVVLENSATIAVVRHKFPNITLIPAKSYQEAFKIIETNRADAFAGDLSILKGWQLEYPSYRVLSARLSVAALAIIMPKGLQHQKLRSQIDRAISNWTKSGWLQQRIEFWQL